MLRKRDQRTGCAKLMLLLLVGLCQLRMEVSYAADGSCAQCLTAAVNEVLGTDEVGCSTTSVDAAAKRARRYSARMRRAMRACSACELPRRHSQLAAQVRVALLARQAATCESCTGADCPPPAEPSDVLRIRCLPRDGVEVLTPVVAAQSDGLHIEAIDASQSGEVGMMSPAFPNVSFWSGSSSLSEQFVRPLPVGPARVWCIHGPIQQPPELSGQALFTVVDPGSVFVPYRLECGSAAITDLGVSFGFRDSAPTASAAIEGALSGIRPDDVVEQAGYLLMDPEWPYLKGRVVRDGRVIAELDLSRVDGQFGVGGSASACADSGIARRPGEPFP